MSKKTGITYYTTAEVPHVLYGCDHRHRTLEAAWKCFDKHNKACARHGGYSPRRVVAGMHDGSWAVQTRGETEAEYDMNANTIVCA